MTKSERRIKQLEQQSTQGDEEIMSPELIHLLEEMLGEKMSEEAKRRPEKRGGPLDPELQALIDKIIA
jgi:hypothetical protein